MTRKDLQLQVQEYQCPVFSETYGQIFSNVNWNMHPRGATVITSLLPDSVLTRVRVSEFWQMYPNGEGRSHLSKPSKCNLMMTS